MKTFQYCPVCNAKVTVWRLVMTGEPHFLRCPSCKSRLTFGKLWDWWELFSALAAGAVLIPIGVALIVSGISRNTVYAVGLVSLLAVYVVGALVVLHHAVLQKR